MLPSSHKLTRAEDFRGTMRNGIRGSSRTLLVFVWTPSTEPDLVATGGPKFGLVVSKAVGNAVTRHRISRKLRALCFDAKENFSRSTKMVIRALPAAGEATNEQLALDFEVALGKVRRKAEKGATDDAQR